MPEIEKINYVVKKSVTYLGISSLGDSAVTYLLKIQSLPDKQWQVKRDALRIIKNTFEELGKDNPYECIKVISAWGEQSKWNYKDGFYLGTVLKYISRAGRKDNNSKSQDLQKCVNYLTMYISELENTERSE